MTEEKIDNDPPSPRWKINWGVNTKTFLAVENLDYFEEKPRGAVFFCLVRFLFDEAAIAPWRNN